MPARKCLFSSSMLVMHTKLTCSPPMSVRTYAAHLTTSTGLRTHTPNTLCLLRKRVMYCKQYTPPKVPGQQAMNGTSLVARFSKRWDSWKIRQIMQSSFSEMEKISSCSFQMSMTSWFYPPAPSCTFVSEINYKPCSILQLRKETQSIFSTFVSLVPNMQLVLTFGYGGAVLPPSREIHSNENPHANRLRIWTGICRWNSSH